jgi:hypothetical protein
VLKGSRPHFSETIVKKNQCHGNQSQNNQSNLQISRKIMNGSLENMNLIKLAFKISRRLKNGLGGKVMLLLKKF